MRQDGRHLVVIVVLYLLMRIDDAAGDGDADDRSIHGDEPPPDHHVCKSYITSGIANSCPLSEYCCEDENKPGVVNCCPFDPSPTTRWPHLRKLMKAGSTVLMLLALCCCACCQRLCGTTSDDDGSADQPLQNLSDSNDERRIAPAV